LAYASTPAHTIAALLPARGETLAVAETTAGGLISSTLLAVPGASAWFLGATVAYSPAARAVWLGLAPDAFAPHGAVSEPAAAMMAGAVRRTLGATWGLAETGIAGPQTGRRSAKPAGLAFVAVTGPVSRTRELRTGLEDRSANQAAFARAAIELLAWALEQAAA
jgi:PncC family amidohydrolase